MKETVEILAEVAAKLHASPRIEWNEINEKILGSKTRIREVARSRQWLGYMLYNYCGLTLVEAGRIIGKDHSSLVYYNECINSDLKICKRAQFKLDCLIKTLKGERVFIPMPTQVKRKNFYILSERDKEFLTANANKYSVVYLADVLSKSRKAVRDFIKPLLKKVTYASRVTSRENPYLAARLNNSFSFNQ